jgi:predicted Fe-Mo cluster-binding NifX family protein
MNIAVAAEGKSLDSQVSEKFEKCLHLLIVNMNDLSITAIKNDESFGNSSGENLANEVLKYDCEALITGNIESTPFDILADAGISRFLGVGHSVQKALELMEKRSLKYIKTYDGKDSCGGHHH